MDRITENDWAVKLPFQNGQECESVDARSLTHQSGCDGQTKQSVSHRPPEGAVQSGRMIDMERIEVSRQTGEDDDIGLRYGPTWALPLIADHEIVE